MCLASIKANIPSNLSDGISRVSTKIMDKTKMSNLDRHLDNIAAAIAVGKEADDFLKQDFIVIRDYLWDILKQNVVFERALTESKFLDPNFNCSVVLDVSRFIGLKARCDPNLASCLKIVKTVVKDDAWLATTPFGKYHSVFRGDILTEFVRETIALGLQRGGCFVRGHRGDVYELDVAEKSVKLHGELQCNYVTINASSDQGVLVIRLRVLMKWFPRRDEPEPYPSHNLKSFWMPVADVRGCSFSICTPLSELEMSKHTPVCMAYRLLSLLFHKLGLDSLREVHLLSVCYENLYTRLGVGRMTGCTIVAVMIEVMRRMLDYLSKRRYLFYWNTHIDLAKLFPKDSRRCLRKSLVLLVDNIKAMEQRKTLTYDEVEGFFGIQINPDIVHVDQYGVYKSFSQPQS